MAARHECATDVYDQRLQNDAGAGYRADVSALQNSSPQSCPGGRPISAGEWANAGDQLTAANPSLFANPPAIALMNAHLHSEFDDERDHQRYDYGD
jgi:hypothetical protein